MHSENTNDDVLRLAGTWSHQHGSWALKQKQNQLRLKVEQRRFTYEAYSTHEKTNEYHHEIVLDFNHSHHEQGQAGEAKHVFAFPLEGEQPESGVYQLQVQLELTFEN